MKNNLSSFFWLLLLLPLIWVLACSKSDEVAAPTDAEDDAKIQAYIKAQNLTALKTDEGVYYTIDVEGSGGSPTAMSDINMKYKGYLLNGNPFDQGTLNGTSLRNLISGWQIAVPKFKKGGKGKLLIPSRYGYGSRAVGTIPAHSILVFEIELIDFR